MHRRPALPDRRLPRGHRPGPADPARRRPPAGAAEPVRRLRRAARRRHRRLGRRLAGDRRPRQPRAALAGPRPPARGHRGPRASRWRPGSPSTPSSSLDPDRWLDAGLRFAVMDRSDAEGLGRDDPGAVFARADQPAAAERSATAPRSSTIGPALAPRGTRVPTVDPPALVPGRPGAARARSARCWPASLLGQELGDRRDRHPVLGPRARGGRGRRGGRRAASPGRRRRRHLGAQPQHQLHQRVHVQVPVLRLLEGPAVAQPAGHALPADPRRHRRAGRARRAELGATEVCLQGGIHPDFDGDYYIDVDPGGEGGRARHARARLHRAGGDRGGQAARRAARPTTCAACTDAGLRIPAGHRGRDPRRRDPGHPLPRQDQHRASGSRPTAPPTRSGCDSNVTIMFGAVEQPGALGPPHRAHPRRCRRRPAASPSSCRCRSCTWPRRSTCSARPGAGPTFRETVLMHAVGRIAYHGWIDNIQASWVKIGPRRRPPAAAGRRQRPRRHADGREHLPGRRRHPRPGHGRGRLPRAGRAARPHASSSAPRSTAGSAVA